MCSLECARISVMEIGAKLGTSRGMALAFSIMAHHWYVELRGISDFKANWVSERWLYTKSSQVARRVVSKNMKWTDVKGAHALEFEFSCQLILIWHLGIYVRIIAGKVNLFLVWGQFCFFLSEILFLKYFYLRDRGGERNIDMRAKEWIGCLLHPPWDRACSQSMCPDHKSPLRCTGWHLINWATLASVLSESLSDISPPHSCLA